MNFPTANTAAKPRAFLLIAMALLAAIAMTCVAMSDRASARSGGVAISSGSDETTTKSSLKYDRLYTRISAPAKRWARTTSECESGGDPRAIGGGGIYRGAFQFLRKTWKGSPRSPGGDPIAYSYRTQAVVAVALKKREGANPWPACG